MLYREIIAVCSQIHTKLINTLCGQNVELLNVKPSCTVHIVTAVVQMIASLCEVYRIKSISVLDVNSPEWA